MDQTDSAKTCNMHRMLKQRVETWGRQHAHALAGSEVSLLWVNILNNKECYLVSESNGTISRLLIFCNILRVVSQLFAIAIDITSCNSHNALWKTHLWATLDNMWNHTWHTLVKPSHLNNFPWLFRAFRSSDHSYAFVHLIHSLCEGWATRIFI